MKPLLLFSVAPLLLVAAACVGGSGTAGGPAGTFADDDPGAEPEESSGAGRLDGGGGREGGGGTGAGGSGGDDDAEIDLTFTGCTPVFEDVRVVTNVVAYDSLAVSSAYAPMNGGVQVALKDPTPRTVALSTTQRTASSDSVVINVYAGGTTFTNLCNPTLPPTGCYYDAPTSAWKNDPVTGSFQIEEYDPQNGKLDVTFSGVVLAAVSGNATCTVNGTLVTKRLSH